MIFQDRRQAHCLDLEAVETAIRSAMHRAGAELLTELLQYDPPDADHRRSPCACGQSALYKELRKKTLLTVLGPVRLNRPYYHGDHCSNGHFPIDTEWASLTWSLRPASDAWKR